MVELRPSGPHRRRSLLVGALVCLAVQGLWLLPPRRPAHAAWLVTRPTGAGVWVQRFELGILRAGKVGAGYRLVYAGRTPGPLDLDPTGPSDLVVRLAGYQDAAVRYTPGSDPAPLALTPRWPVVVPLAYAARDFGWLGGAGLLVGLVLSGWRRERREARAAERRRRALTLHGVREGVELDGYRLDECVGRGGMARVYRARRMEDGAPVAVKVLAASAAPAALRDEVRGLRGLAHPHLALLLDWGQASDFHYLVTEFVEGETLHARLRRGPLAVDEARRVAREAAEALAHAHRRGVIHRDLKPGNVMLDRSGAARVTDFGIARRTGEAGGGGTPGYMPPEQARGGAADARGDVYALGAVLYEALSGRAAFPGDSETERLARQIAGDPPPLEGIPPDLAALVAAMLARDPAARPSSMDEVARRLGQGFGERG